MAGCMYGLTHSEAQDLAQRQDGAITSHLPRGINLGRHARTDWKFAPYRPLTEPGMLIFNFCCHIRTSVVGRSPLSARVCPGHRCVRAFSRWMARKMRKSLQRCIVY